MPTRSSLDGSRRCTGARPRRPPDAELEGRQHLGERTAVAVEHHAGAHLRHAQPMLLGRVAPPPPRPGMSVRGSRCPRERPRRSARRRARRSSRSRSRSPAPAGARPRRVRRCLARDVACRSRGYREWPAWPLAPALRDVLAGQVHDRVASGKAGAGAGSRMGSQRSALVERVAARLVVSGDSRARVDRSNCSRARSGSRESTVTSSPRSLSAATTRGPIRPVAPVTVTRMALRSVLSLAARRRPVARVSRWCELRCSPMPVRVSPCAKPTSCPASASPLARACSATAAATAGATSRLKTEGMM